MAYMQKPGRGPLANKKVEALTNGTPLKQEKNIFEIGEDKKPSRYERANKIANKKAKAAGSPSTFMGDFGGGGGGSTDGTAEVGGGCRGVNLNPFAIHSVKVVYYCQR